MAKGTRRDRPAVGGGRVPLASARRTRRWRIRLPQAKWKRAVLGIGAGFAVVLAIILGYYYVQFSRIIEARLHGERDRVIPRVFARPLRLHTGQGLSEAELVARLNDVGYTEKSRVERPGEFAIDRDSVVFVPRGGDQAGKPVRIAFAERKAVAVARRPATPAAGLVERVEAAGKTVDEVTIDPPILAGLVTGSREKRRR